MRNILIVGVLTASFMACVSHVSQAAEASPCKGLENATCTANAACKWQPERIAGQTLTQKGEPAKTSAKAHCRKAASQTAKADPAK